MPGVLTTDSTVLCGHLGAVAKPSTEKLKVNGFSVLLKSSLIGSGVTNCGTTGSGTKKCEKVMSVVTGESIKLKAGGSPVMLDTLRGKTEGNPIGNLPATADQTKLTAI